MLPAPRVGDSAGVDATNPRDSIQMGDGFLVDFPKEIASLLS
jgi:hypothetical protein